MYNISIYMGAPAGARARARASASEAKSERSGRVAEGRGVVSRSSRARGEGGRNSTGSQHISQRHPGINVVVVALVADAVSSKRGASRGGEAPTFFRARIFPRVGRLHKNLIPSVSSSHRLEDDSSTNSSARARARDSAEGCGRL